MNCPLCGGPIRVRRKTHPGPRKAIRLTYCPRCIGAGNAEARGATIEIPLRDHDKLKARIAELEVQVRNHQLMLLAAFRLRDQQREETSPVPPK